MGVPGNFERGAAVAGRVPDTDTDANPTRATNLIGGGDPDSDGPDASSFGGPLNLDDPKSV